MTVCVYSKAKDGNKKLSSNFTVREFACADGSDTIFISQRLVEVLQAIRNHFGKPVTINSGYRTESHNAKVSGATYSQHKYGTAADITINGVRPEVVAEYARAIMQSYGGVGIYNNFAHVDVRDVKTTWLG